jgi:hypothetical protein
MITAPKKLNLSLIFKVKILVKYYIEDKQDGKLLDSPANNRLGCKGISQSNFYG